MKDYDDIEEREYSPMRKGVMSGLKSPYLLAGIVGAVLLVCLVIFSLGGGAAVEDDRLFALEDRISLLEEKISELEGLYNEASNATSNVEDQSGKVDLLGERLARLESAIPKITDQLNRELAKLKKAAAVTRKKKTETTTAAAPGKKKTETTTAAAPPKKTEAVHHLVKPGETLYSISRKYKSLYQTSVKKLRDLNKLGDGDPIKVGQKLLIHR